MPPTPTFFPAHLAISPTMVVTVLLPFDPVMAIIGTLTEQANKSISLIIFEPLATALTIDFSVSATPGLTTKWVATLKAASSKPPVKTGVSGITSKKASINGGLARLSVMAKLNPSFCK